MTTSDPVRVGILGCGDIAPVYLDSLGHFGEVNCIAVADVSRPRAAALASDHGVRRVVDPELLCTDPDIELVLNLTPPQAHFHLARRAVEAGKHVYNEKPLAATPTHARQLLMAARRQGVRVGCAPATWLGGVWQTCRSLVDRGVIGRPIGANAFFLERGYESWHPRPRPYFWPGAGPLLDMGPYAVAALVFLLGAVRRVFGFASTAIPERVIGSGRQSSRFTVGVADHVTGAMQFTNGAVATITASYAVWPPAIERLLLFGTEATLCLPPANRLGGTIWLHSPSHPDWHRVPLRHGLISQRRAWAVGVAEMAHALRRHREHRASGLLGLHVIEVLHGLLASSNGGPARTPRNLPQRPEPLLSGLGNEVFG